jgi:hypothetical protein
MATCIEIFNREKGNSAIGGSIYIDPMGYEYRKDTIVNCLGCIFYMGCDSCVLKKENGLSDEKIKNDIFNVNKNNECSYFLIKDYSEGGNEDEMARKEIENIAKELNYPQERWRRHNIHENMDIKNIRFNTYNNQNCRVCKFCQNPHSDISFCNYHNIEIFADERVCDFFQSTDGNNESIEIIYSATAQDDFIALGNFFIKGENKQCIVYDKNKNIVTDIDAYLLRTIKYDTSENQIIFEYVHKMIIFNIDTETFLKESNETEDSEETSYWSNVSDEELFREADKIYNNTKDYGLYEVSNHRDGCEYCDFVVRDSSSATNLKCTKKNIFVPANLQCAEFKK